MSFNSFNCATGGMPWPGGRGAPPLPPPCWSPSSCGFRLGRLRFEGFQEQGQSGQGGLLGLLRRLARLLAIEPTGRLGHLGGGAGQGQLEHRGGVEFLAQPRGLLLEQPLFPGRLAEARRLGVGQTRLRLAEAVEPPHLVDRALLPLAQGLDRVLDSGDLLAGQFRFGLLATLGKVGGGLVQGLLRFVGLVGGILPGARLGRLARLAHLPGRRLRGSSRLLGQQPLEPSGHRLGLFLKLLLLATEPGQFAGSLGLGLLIGRLANRLSRPSCFCAISASSVSAWRSFFTNRASSLSRRLERMSRSSSRSSSACCCRAVAWPV